MSMREDLEKILKEIKRAMSEESEKEKEDSSEKISKEIIDFYNKKLLSKEKLDLDSIMGSELNKTLAFLGINTGEVEAKEESEENNKREKEHRLFAKKMRENYERDGDAKLFEKMCISRNKEMMSGSSKKEQEYILECFDNALISLTKLDQCVFISTQDSESAIDQIGRQVFSMRKSVLESMK